jgi:hypothetical protein
MDQTISDLHEIALQKSFATDWLMRLQFLDINALQQKINLLMTQTHGFIVAGRWPPFKPITIQALDPEGKSSFIKIQKFDLVSAFIDKDIQ